VLQTETGATATAQFLADQFNPLPGTDLTVNRAAGSWLGSIRLTGVTLTRTDSTSDADVVMAAVDTLEAEYRLLGLLQNHLHLTQAVVAGPSLTLRQAADSTWDWTAVLPAADADTSARSFTVQLDRLDLRRGQFAAQFYAGGRDSTARVTDLKMTASDLAVGEAVSVRLDTLGWTARVPGDTTDLRFATAGHLTPTTLGLDTLLLDSPRSHVRGGGSARLPTGPDDDLDQVDLSVRAAPLSFRDVASLLPTLGLDPNETVELQARLTGSGSLLQATADASFTGGGTVTAQAELTPTTTSPADSAGLRYRLDARVRDLTTSLLGPRDPALNRLSTDVFADLSGPSLDRLDGPVRAILRRTRLSGLRADSLSLDGTFRDGRAALRLGGRLNGARLRADGRIRPFDATPTYNGTVQVRDLDVEQFAPGSGLDTRIAATVNASGQSFGGAEGQVRLAIDLGASRIEDQSVDGGRVLFRLRPDSVSVETDVRLPTGRLWARGRADRSGSQRVSIDTARVENLNVAALVGDTTSSALTGTVQASGRGFSAQTLQMDGRLRLTESHYGTYRLSSLEGTASLRDGRLTTDARAVLNGGTWSVSATSRPFDAPLTATLREGRFQGVNLGAFAAAPSRPDPLSGEAEEPADSTGMSDLNGSLTGSLRGMDPASMQANLRMDFDRSRLNRQPIEPGTSVDVGLDRGRLDATLSLALPDGSAQLAATSQPFADVATYRLTEGRFENLDVGALAGLPGWRAPLSGTLEADGRGTALADLQLTSRLRLDRSAVNRETLTTGAVQVSIDAGRADLSGALDFAGDGRIRLSGTADSLGAAPTYTASVAAGRLNVGALAGLDSTLTAQADSVTWQVDGRGLSPETLSAETVLASGRIQVGQFRVEGLRLDGRLDRGTLTLDTLNVRSNAVQAAGSGRLALIDTTVTSDLDLVAAVTDARSLRRLLGANNLSLSRARAELHIYGSTGDLRFDGQSKVHRFVYDDLRLADLQVQFNGAGDLERGLQTGTLRGELGFLSNAALSIEDTQLDLRYDPSRLTLQSSLRLDRQRTAALDASITPHLDRSRFTVETLSMRLGPDQWQLLQPSTIDYGDAYRINSFLLYSGSQQIAADGVVDLDGRQNFVLTVEQFRLGAVADLVGLSGLGGRLTGSVDLTGPATAPVLGARLDTDLQSDGRPVGTLQLGVRYDSLTTSIDATLEHAEGQQFRASGRLPTDLRLQALAPVDIGNRPVSLTLAAEAFPMDWIDPFLDSATVRDVRGVLQADVAVNGTLDDPDLDGQASLENAGAFLPTLGVTYSRGTADIAFVDDRAQVRQARLRSANGGRMEANGTVNFSDLTLGEFDLSVQARDFIAIDDRAYSDAVLDGSFTLRGTTRRPVLNGTAEIKQVDVFFTEATAASESDYATVQLTEDDQLALEERFGLRLTTADTTTFNAYEVLAMDLSVRIRGDTWLRSDGTPEMNIQFSGDLDLEKQANEDAQVFGTIEVVTARSTVRYLGREFQLEEGTITFNGDATSPYLDLAAVYEQRSQGTTNETSVTITLSLEGRPEDLSPNLTSAPPMDTRNILSYLATGKPANEILSGSGGGSLTESVPLGVAASFAENFAANRLGLDVVRFQYRSGGEWYLTVGQYLTPRFYAAIEQSVGSGFTDQSTREIVPDLTLEYQLTSYMQLRTVRRQSSLRFNLFLEYAY